MSSPDEPDRAGCASCAPALADPGPRYVSVVSDPKLAEQLISGQAGTVVCDSCGTSRDAWVPLLYDDPDHDLLIYVAAADSEQLAEEYHGYIAMLGPVLPAEAYRRATEDQYEIVVGLTGLRTIAQAAMQGVVLFKLVPSLTEAPRFDMSRLLDIAAEYRNAGNIGAAYAVLKRGLTFPTSDASYLREFGAYALAAGDITVAEETLREVSELTHRLRHVPVIRILGQGGIAPPDVMPPMFFEAVRLRSKRERPELSRSELETAQLVGQIAGEAEHAMMVLSETSERLNFIRDITVHGFEMWVSSDARPDAEDDLRAAFRQARTHYRGPISLDGEADVLLRLGVMLAATEEVAAAEQALCRAKQSESLQIQAEAALHLGFLLHGRDQDAAAENFSLATGSPVARTSAQAFLSLAHLALGRGGRQEAQGFLHNAASIGAEPVSSRALLELARMANEDGDDAIEERFLAELVNADYGHVTATAGYRLGFICLKRGDLETAERLFMLTDNTADVELKLRSSCMVGMIRAARGDTEGARQILGQVTMFGFAEPDTFLADIAAQAKQLLEHLPADEQERLVLQRSLLEGYATAGRPVWAGSERVQQEKGPGTRSGTQQASDSRRQNAADVYGLGSRLAEQGDTAEARAAYQKAIDTGHPDYAPAAGVRLGALLAGQGDTAGAQAAYRKAIDSGHPEHAPNAAVNLGALLAGQGDKAGARAAYQKAIDSGHSRYARQAAAGLESLLAGQGDFTAAETARQNANDSRSPKSAPKTLSNRGLLPAARGTFGLLRSRGRARRKDGGAG